VPPRVRRGEPAAVAAAHERWVRREAGRDDVRLLVKDTLALLGELAPGSSVEVRVPPYAAVQVVGGTTHRRGTPPAVVETDPLTWLDLVYGRQDWASACAAGEVLASGERSDLSDLLPLGDAGHQET
jgi:hypothetical protein